MFSAFDLFRHFAHILDLSLEICTNVLVFECAFDQLVNIHFSNKNGRCQTKTYGS